MTGLVEPLNEIEISFSDQRFAARESTGQLTAILAITGNSSRSFDVNVIPSMKNPPSAQGTVMCVYTQVGA